MTADVSKWIPAAALLGILVGGATFWWGQQPPAWSAGERTTLRALALARRGPVPADPSNVVADDLRAVALGQKLFYDTRLSANGQVACATCHLPERYFTDGRPLGKGVGTVGRHTMSLVGASDSPWLTWDGKNDSQWAQALIPLENPAEHGADRTALAHQMAVLYRSEYEDLFGPLPDLADSRRFPPQAAPVDDPALRAAWDGMTAVDQDAVNRVFANLGKALAAYERTVQPTAARFDAFVAALEGDAATAHTLLSAEETAGLRLFLGKAHCINCHNGPLFTNHEFHNTAVPGVPGLPLDYGRSAGIRRLQADPFNCLGPYSDAQPDQCTQLRFLKTTGNTGEGAFKTPSLRNVAATAPYMHAGQFATLREVLEHYNSGGYALIGHNELAPLNLSDRELDQLEAFLQTLTGPLGPAGN